MHRPLPPRGKEGGFVLLLVLVLLVVISLLASTVALISRQSVEAAIAEVDAFEGETDMLSTQQTLLFLLSTQPRSAAGLTIDNARKGISSADESTYGLSAFPVGNEIRLDNRGYIGLGNSAFSIQDDRGLINPNWIFPGILQQFYARQKSSPGDWGGLEAKRLDYQDADDLKRLNGAESAEYVKAGLPPPANRPLSSPLELRRILGWEKLLSGMDDTELVNTFSVAQENTINLNTAPANVLTLVPGLDADAATRLIAQRDLAPYLYRWSIESTFPIPTYMDDVISLFSADSGNLTLWDRHGGRLKLIHWTLTPLKEGAPPWRVDYEVDLPRGQQSDEELAQAPASPLFATPDQDRH